MATCHDENHTGLLIGDIGVVRSVMRMHRFLLMAEANVMSPKDRPLSFFRVMLTKSIFHICEREIPQNYAYHTKKV